ncbi:hypothetical protein GLAREA_06419 [Glarea lozoyensis ATCC 20868]|uniref:Uncharacterized protein n=1 Tax=Glarea lozoyensis (strain ATCC 20868 / MF5171) TaxID=1116229 RepID=S3DMT4_GLAL2|nr:uncharacterized protein GLAREA_06419 [Glarea lozoyensis ATCC 20868]EPE33406.1 hypothetical protein GLAREA_06419 [Glarea lozoyensis ATCC 20868]
MAPTDRAQQALGQRAKCRASTLPLHAALDTSPFPQLLCAIVQSCSISKLVIGAAGAIRNLLFANNTCGWCRPSGGVEVEMVITSIFSLLVLDVESWIWRVVTG